MEGIMVRELPSRRAHKLSKSEPAGPSTAIIKQLFAHSGNRCAFPKCAASIVVDGAIVGEICRIHAASRGGPRCDPAQSAAERHGYDNLILLCANHHTVIDS